MPLSPPTAREHLHTRAITLHGYKREDGLFDIEAALTDTKTYDFANHDRGTVTAGTPLHGMLARMTVDEAMLIVRFEAVTEYGPFNICPDAAPLFERLAGLSIGRGFLKAANERIRELERALGKKAMEVEILQAARDEVKKRPNYYGVYKK